ncbi:hypothetical protein BOX15_Mlig009386g1 [Macrostomum lignano]|uniref:Armadillo segment polarity protein n=3 Tax=Macrostomum lignano TaxID=282301 RepID=A0A267FDD8_9PLAT|nr:hypothetical protein BOX15_Mlig009386g1 [Macrostomum lignano]
MSTFRSSYREATTPTGASAAAGPVNFSASLDRQSVSMDTLNRQMHRGRAVRVRQALFPETVGAEAEQMAGLETLTRGRRRLPTSVQQLAEPAQILRTAVVNLINYQEDADVALHAAAELARLLGSSDPVTCQRAASLTLQLSKKQACRLAFAVQVDLIEALLIVVQTAQSVEALRFAVGALCHICQAEQGCATVYQCGRVRAVPELLRLLGSTDVRTRNYALTCLHHLLVHLEEARNEARMASGAQVLSELLLSIVSTSWQQASVSSPPPPMSPPLSAASTGSGSEAQQQQKLMAVCIDSLQLLAFANQESKLVLLSCGAVDQLVNLLLTSRYEKLLFSTSRLLKVLSVEPSCKSAILAAGGITALGRHLKSTGSERLVMNALWTIRNLSDQAFTLNQPLDQLLVDLIGLLASPDIDCVTCAAGILCNLTCRNRRNKFVVTSSGGAGALSLTLLATQDREEIAEPLMCALRHITHDHEQACAAADAVLSHGLACTLGELLHRAAVVADATTVGVGVSVANDEPGGPAASRPLVKAALGLCRNLSLHAAGRAALHAESAPAAASAIAAATLARGIDALLDDAGSIASAGGADDGVRAEEVLEAALACLHSLAGGADGEGDGETDPIEARRQRDAVAAAVRSRPGLPDSVAELAAGGVVGSSCVGPAGDLLERLATANAATGSTSATLQRRPAVELTDEQQQQRHLSDRSSVLDVPDVSVRPYRYDPERSGATLPVNYAAQLPPSYHTYQQEQQLQPEPPQHWYNTAKI